MSANDPLLVSWHSFDLRTGIRGQVIPLNTAPSFSRIIGEATDTTLQVQIWDPTIEGPDPQNPGGQVPGVMTATEPGRTMLLALDQHDRILWGGMVLRRVSDAGSSTTLSVATLEHYFARRYVGDLFWETTDQATIAAGIIDEAYVDGLSFYIDVPATGRLRDWTAYDSADQTVLSQLTTLLEVENGLEFTVDLVWADENHTQIDKIVRLRERLGVSPTVPVEFRLPGVVDNFEYVEDYSEEFGANDTMATSSGEGEARPTSQHAVNNELIANGWPRYERRFQPASSTDDTALLDAAAAEDLREHQFGLRDFSFSARLSADGVPLPGVDFHLGDVVQAVLTCARFPPRVDSAGVLQPGFVERVRCIGWTIDLSAGSLKPLIRREGDR